MSRIQWEYDHEYSAEKLNEMGRQGWEAYAITVENVPADPNNPRSMPYQAFTYHLKRRIESATEGDNRPLVEALVEIERLASTDSTVYEIASAALLNHTKKSDKP